MNKFIILLCALMLPAALTAQGDQEVESGNLRSKSYNLNGFTGIKNTLQGDLQIEIGEEWEVRAEGDSSFINILDIFVRDGELVIRTKPGQWNFRLRNNLTLYVTLPYLESLKLTGSGDALVKDPVRGDNFDLHLTGSGSAEMVAEVDVMNVTQTGSGSTSLIIEANEMNIKLTGSGDSLLQGSFSQLNTRLTGSGDIELTGFADSIISVQNGSGHLEGELFEVKQADITLTGSGDAEMTVLEELNLKLTGSGDFRYQGNPQIGEIKMTGSGTLKHL